MLWLTGSGNGWNPKMTTSKIRGIAIDTIAGTALAIIVLVILAGCAPGEPTLTPQLTKMPAPTPTIEFLNDNPDLQLGGCKFVTFHTDKFGQETIKQCNPSRYPIYEQVGYGSYNIRIIHTGEGYYILPNGAYGKIGFTMPVMELTTDALIKVHFFSNVEGELGDYSLDAKVNGVLVGQHLLEGNGPSMAMFSIIGVRGAASVDIYLNIIHASMTASSYITITSITVEKVE
jgi:hypothetical protein